MSNAMREALQEFIDAADREQFGVFPDDYEAELSRARAAVDARDEDAPAARVHKAGGPMDVVPVVLSASVVAGQLLYAQPSEAAETIEKPTTLLTKADTRALWHAVEAYWFQAREMRKMAEFSQELIDGEQERANAARAALRKVNAIRRGQR